MSRDSGSEHPSQRTVAELLAEYGGGSQRSGHRRRRRAEDPSETAPQAIIERVLSDSGKMRPIRPEEDAPGEAGRQPQQPGPAQGPQQPAPGPAPSAAAQPPAAPAPPAPAPPAQPPAAQAPPAASPVQPPPAGPPQQYGPSTGPQRVTPQQPPAAPQNAAPQSPAAPQPQQSPAPQAPAPEAEEDSGKPGGNFWTRRFTAAGAPPRAAQQDASAGSGDDQATVQHAALGTPQQAHQGPAADSATEQLPMVEAEARSAADGTAMLTPPDADAPAQDPYGYAYDEYGYDEGYPQDGYPSADYDGYPDGTYQDGQGAYGADPYDADDEYDAALPAGMDADDYRADEDPAEDQEPQQTSGREWLVLALQGGAGLVAGGAVWFAFRWLWMAIPIAALVAALVITTALVFVARRFLRTDDLQTILLAVLVGLICTVSPAALLLIGQ